MPSQKKKSIKKTNKGNKSIIPQSNPINNNNNNNNNTSTNNSTNTNSSNVTESFSFGSNLLHQNNNKTVTSNTSSSDNNNNDNSNLESCTAVNEDPTVQQLIAKDKPVVDWMLRKANAEKQKLQKQGARVKILRVKNTSLIRQTEQEEEEESSEKKTTITTTETTEKKPIVEKILNRVELDCLLDFEHVVQLMVSEPEICEVKTERNDFYYVNVILLMSNGSFAYLFPYLYHKNEQQVNALQHWALINNQLKRTDISIDSFEQVHQDE